jgi:Tfp pilus assembly protein PilN
MKIDIKTGVLLVTILFSTAGFYYTTKSKLDDAEREIAFLWGKIGQLEKTTSRLQRLIYRHTKKESHQE